MRKLSKEETNQVRGKFKGRNQKSDLIKHLDELEIGESLFVKTIEIANSGYKSDIRQLVNYYQYSLEKKFSVARKKERYGYLIERTE